MKMESAMDQMFETLDEGDKTTEASPAQVFLKCHLLSFFMTNILVKTLLLLKFKFASQ